MQAAAVITGSSPKCSGPQAAQEAPTFVEGALVSVGGHPGGVEQAVGAGRCARRLLGNVAAPVVQELLRRRSSLDLEHLRAPGSTQQVSRCGAPWHHSRLHRQLPWPHDEQQQAVQHAAQVCSKQPPNNQRCRQLPAHLMEPQLHLQRLQAAAAQESGPLRVGRLAGHQRQRPAVLPTRAGGSWMSDGVAEQGSTWAIHAPAAGLLSPAGLLHLASRPPAPTLLPSWQYSKRCSRQCIQMTAPCCATLPPLSHPAPPP